MLGSGSHNIILMRFITYLLFLLIILENLSANAFYNWVDQNKNVIKKKYKETLYL